MILSGMKEWANNPVTTSIDTIAAPNKEVNYPAITVCHDKPHQHSSWKVTEKIFNFLDFLHCNEGCNPQDMIEVRSAFGDFTANLIDKQLATKDFTNTFYHEYNFCAPECIGQPQIGGFLLPSGYNGMDMNGVTFRTAYCPLAKKVEEKMNATGGTYLQQVTVRWKSSMVTLEAFNVDVLAEELEVHIDFTLFYYSHLWYECELSEEAEKVMSFLAKFYLLDDPKILYENFGTTMKHLVKHGNLQIYSWAAARNWDGVDWRVSFFFDLNLPNRLLLGQK